MFQRSYSSNYWLLWLGSIILSFKILDASGGVYVTCGTGRCFALAVANSSIHGAIITHDLYFSDNDWQGLPQPVILHRDFAVTSGPGPWRTIDFGYSRQKVQLANGATFAFTAIVLHNVRRKPPARTPGMDLLAPSPPSDNTTAVVLLHDTMMTLRACYPRYINLVNIGSLRRSSTVLGTNVLRLVASPPGTCRPDLNASLSERCWSDIVMYDDVAMDGMDLSDNDMPVPTHYVVRLVNTSGVCLTVLSDDCIAALTPLGCMSQALSAPLPPLPPMMSSPEEVLLDPPITASTSGVSSASGQGGSGNPPVALLLGGLLGGLGALGALLLVVLLVVKRHTPSPWWPGGLGDSSRRPEPSSGVVSVSLAAGDGGKVLCGSGASSGVAAAAGAVMVNTLSSGSIRLLQKRPTAEPLRSDEQVTIYTPGHGLGHDPDNSAHPLESPVQLAAGLNPAAPGHVIAVRSMAPSADSAALAAELVSPRMPSDLLEDCVAMHPDNELVLEKRTLGKGAFGHVVVGVYRGQRVAVKLIRQHVPQALVALEDNVAAQLLLREVEVLGRCQHPNVVRLLAANLAPPRPCLVMELMETNLERLLYGRPGELLPLDQVLHIAIEMARGLEYLHPTVAHRDIKPANVLINEPDSPRPVVKLADFGLSRLRLTEAPTQHPDVGTAAYMGPECFDPANFVITHKADMFSLGVLLAEMLVGQQPWPRMQPLEIGWKVALRGFRPFSLQDMSSARCPGKLKAVIQDCWESDPMRRPAAAELAKDLEVIRQRLGQQNALA